MSAEHHILSDLQSRFRSGHGLATATLKVLDDIIIDLDNKQVYIGSSIDLAKAFDSVDHMTFLGRLSGILYPPPIATGLPAT